KNSKYADGRMCEILRADGPRYSIEDLKHFCVPTNGAAAEKVDIGNNNGELPSKFNKLLAKHTLIKKTWNVERPDLKDQTHSGFDMAMTNLLVGFGFVPQEIAAILRTMPSGKGAKASRAYLETTIAKAWKNRTEETTADEKDSETEEKLLFETMD